VKEIARATGEVAATIADTSMVAIEGVSITDLGSAMTSGRE
jgi:hypothetical protein